jgi:hypothetical protein
LGAQRETHGAFDRTEAAGDQTNDVVEIGVVIEAADPRLIGGAAMGSGTQAERCDDHSYGHDAPVQTLSLRHCAPLLPSGKRRTAELYPDF